MIIKNFIPKNNEELIEKTNNNLFKGKFILKDDIIYWQYDEITILRIILFNQQDESYVEYFVNGWGHDHIPVDELYSFLIEINNMEFSIRYKNNLFGKKTQYIELINSNNSFENIMDFHPYKSIGKLKFGDSEKKIKKILGKSRKEYREYNGSKTVIYSNYSDIHVYLDSKNNLYGVHFFNSLTFKLNDTFYIINFNSFNKDDLIKISDDFVITAIEEGVDYTSKKLGIDFYFNDDNKLDGVLFMCCEYYNNEIEH